MRGLPWGLSVWFAMFGSVALLGTLLLSTACRPLNVPPVNEDPGTTYVITGALTSNACAPGLDPINPLIFAASMRTEGSLAYWRIGDQPWIPGTLGREGDFHFTLSSDMELYPATPGTDPELDPGSPGCVVTMVESIDGRLISVAVDAGSADAGAADAAQSGDASTDDAGTDGGVAMMTVLDATNRIELVPFAGTDCSRALLVNGGAFPSLPCAAVYDLEGAP